MPLYREWSSDPYSLAAIWEIGEPESFFLERTGITSDLRHEKRRLEHLAGRFLLRHLEADFPLLHIKPDEHDKPRLEDNRFYFSISHSFPYVAAVVSPYVECGIDIQVWHHRMEVLQHKFLSDREQQYFDNDPRLITLAWCAKEAVYKWQGRRGVDFMEHLPIVNFAEPPANSNIIVEPKLIEGQAPVLIEYLMDQHFACAFVVNEAGEDKQQ